MRSLLTFLLLIGSGFLMLMAILPWAWTGMDYDAKLAASAVAIAGFVVAIVMQALPDMWRK